MKEDTIVLPTYAPGGYDKTPLFYSGRVYQGAQGRVYPYPMQDVLHDEKIDETYKYLTLENDWLQMGLLPEHGGHLLNFTDKQTGFETFYRQHVIKPALIGMLGAWISGGVEWNFPHHHRATTAMPIDWKLAANADDLTALADKLSAFRVVIATEVGGGVVPTDERQRRSREAAGRLACLLAQRADTVVRVRCGLPQVLKGKIPTD